MTTETAHHAQPRQSVFSPSLNWLFAFIPVSVALEMAQQFHAEGDEVAMLAVFDGTRFSTSTRPSAESKALPPAISSDNSGCASRR